MTLSEHARGFSEDYWCPADRGDERASAQTTPLIDGALWVALLKLSNGDPIGPAEHDWLLAQTLIDVKDGVTQLTARGRAALGV